MLNCNTAAHARANAGEWGVYRLERGGRGKPKLYCMCCRLLVFLCLGMCLDRGGGAEMNLKHPCPPLQSHLLLNRFGGERGYSVHTCAPLVVNSGLHHFLKRERKTCCGFCVGEKNQSDTILCLRCCYCVALLSGFSWACLHFDGFCLLSARGEGRC